MKQHILSFFLCLVVLVPQAQTRSTVPGPVVVQPDKEKVLEEEVREDQEIAIYPNPNSGIFTVSLPTSEAKQADLRIMNVIGNEIHREVLTRTNAQFSTTINLNRFAKGLYYVKLETDNFSAIKRVVVK
ncbi:T9SS type A sorting domain-containing protein [Pontibacter qinzhouensis]|uniref:T9SS type A sorting domain-containing protein n=1 Tax=Pontibacter qinzhouensis TaxID=2603253 RepID=A0A5C8KBR6_9BACT|nr:T9SS type A sorting domain-containing protein [Pontibacter qinzhouensis]TXK47431.1 T9SS type A sorting domain-containing protein [Pontibacter qinzhouensis]